MPKYNGKPGQKAGEKSTYNPEMREQYREYYKNRGRGEQPIKQQSAPASAQRSVGAARRPMPQAASNGTRYAAPGTVSSVGQKPGAGQKTISAQRPAAAQKPASAQRPAAQQARPAARPVQRARRRKQNSMQAFLGGVMGGNGAPQYGRMLLFACVLVLVMFGIVKGIGALTRSDEVDYYMPTKITEAPVEQPDGQDQIAIETQTQEQGEQPGGDAQTSVSDEPTAEPTPVIDEGYFPEADETNGSGADEQQEETTVPSTGGRTATLRFAGDIVADTEILATAYNSKADRYDFSDYFSLIRDQLANADMTAINVDGSMGGKDHYRYGYSGYPQFNTPPSLMQTLQNIGVDMLTLCNNHCLDGWFDGLLDTIRNCDKIGMMHIGAFLSEEDYNTPEIYEINGIKIGFLNYTQSTNGMENRGVDANALKWGIRKTNNADYEGDIKKLRSAGAEVVIVVMHWGEEYLLKPDENQVSMANRIAAAGADVIVGGHPHVFQAAGWKTTTLADGTQHKCLIVYSLGNFLSEHRNEKKARTDAGIIFEFTLQENTVTGEIEVVEPKYLPIAVWRVGTEGAFDYRVVSVDATLENRPSGMSSEAYARLQEISLEMEEVYGSSGFERIAY